jgi:hypothetical protein
MATSVPHSLLYETFECEPWRHRQESDMLINREHDRFREKVLDSTTRIQNAKLTYLGDLYFIEIKLNFILNII